MLPGLGQSEFMPVAVPFLLMKGRMCQRGDACGRARAGKAVSASLATHWVANLAIGQLFLPALGKFGVSAVYLFFAAVCAVTVAFTGSQVVETKARPRAVPLAMR